MTDAIRVKALEWKKSRLPGEENILCAESPFGVYRAHVYNSFCRASLDYRTIADFAAFPTLEEAKAACQADFARRVGECVEVGDALKARCDKLKAERNQVIRELIEKAKEIGASIHSPEFVTTDRSTGKAVLYSADLADWLKSQMEGE